MDIRAFDELPLDALEEASGELHRRIAVAARYIGESRADDADAERRSPRRRIAELAALIELAAQTCAATSAGTQPPSGRVDHHPATVAAIMYGAPTLVALLQRLEQDRRMLASHARGLETRLASPSQGAWGDLDLRGMLSEVAIAEPARCAQALELVLARWDEEERRLLEAAGQADALGEV